MACLWVLIPSFRQHQNDKDAKEVDSDMYDMQSSLTFAQSIFADLVATYTFVVGVFGGIDLNLSKAQGQEPSCI
jgi:hypothetical protein